MASRSVIAWTSITLVLSTLIATAQPEGVRVDVKTDQQGPACAVVALLKGGEFADDAYNNQVNGQ